MKNNKTLIILILAFVVLLSGAYILYSQLGQSQTPDQLSVEQQENLKYTIRPIQDAIEHYHYEQMKNVNEVAARAKAQKMLDDYNRKHPKATA